MLYVAETLSTIMTAKVKKYNSSYNSGWTL